MLGECTQFHVKTSLQGNRNGAKIIRVFCLPKGDKESEHWDQINWNQTFKTLPNMPLKPNIGCLGASICMTEGVSGSCNPSSIVERNVVKGQQTNKKLLAFFELRVST